MMATFDLETAKRGELMYRAGRLAMLTYLAIEQIDRTDELAGHVEQAAGLLVDVTHQPSAQSEAAGFFHLEAGETLGL